MEMFSDENRDRQAHKRLALHAEQENLLLLNGLTRGEAVRLVEVRGRVLRGELTEWPIDNGLRFARWLYEHRCIED
jgi:hypothetical protein